MTEPKSITMEVHFDRLKIWSDSLADIICWCRGFHAGSGDKDTGLIMSSVDDLSSMNQRLKDEINKARKSES